MQTDIISPVLQNPGVITNEEKYSKSLVLLQTVFIYRLSTGNFFRFSRKQRIGFSQLSG